ncbi:hypothetical protein [Sphingomonas soli]|uniref:hypothetical protein n=1 Tax=Sphingomonas soli TaxID=266127 RepID=UPI00083042FE|nr:hypothetical protein [Sphingomonas soli]
MHIIKLTALAALSLAVPANAADLATIDCVTQKLQPALKELIEAEVTRSFAEGATRANFDPAVNSGLRLAATNCAIEHKWSEAAATAARDYALGKLSLPIGEKFVAQKGFDVADLETHFGALAEEVRNRPLTKEEMQALVIASVTDEEKQTRENAALLNNYYLILSTVQYAAWNFTQA